MKMFGFDFLFVVPSKKRQKRNPVYTRRTLHLESLENREMLSVGPLLPSDFPFNITEMVCLNKLSADYADGRRLF
jgi:hypothetical protein